MTALYIVLPLALVVATAAVCAFIWTVRSGQLDDVDTPPRRILFDDDRRPVNASLAGSRGGEGCRAGDRGGGPLRPSCRETRPPSG